MLAYLVTLSQHFVSEVQLVGVDLSGEAQQGNVHGGYITCRHLSLLLRHLGRGCTQLVEGISLAVQLQDRLVCACVTAASTM